MVHRSEKKKKKFPLYKTYRIHSELIIVAAFLIAVVLARIIIPRILIISLRKRLFDTPDARKVHKKPVSRLGGVSFFPAILFTVTFLIGICYMTGWVSLVDTGQHWVQILFMCTGLTLLYIVGITDDLIGVRYRQKFLVQLYINDFYGLFGIHAVSPFIGVPLTLVLVIFITNAINLIDGIDGLASGLSMVALSVFGTLAVIDDRWMSALLAFTTVGVLLPFFFYNVFGNADRGRKIFMGDTGSNLLGYVIAFLAIHYAMSGSGRGNGAYVIVIAWSVIFIPAYDALCVIISRWRKKKPLFSPDRSHIHHRLLDLGYGHKKVTTILLLLDVVIISMNVFLTKWANVNLIFLIDLLLGLSFYIFLDVRKKTVCSHLDTYK